MRLAAALLLALAVLGGAFAWWGMFTAAGSRHFDEMDGMIPFFAGMASVGLALCAALAWFKSRPR